MIGSDEFSEAQSWLAFVQFTAELLIALKQ